MPRAYLEEFRHDVVELARRNQTPTAQIERLGSEKRGKVSILGIPQYAGPLLIIAKEPYFYSNDRPIFAAQTKKHGSTA